MGALAHPLPWSCLICRSFSSLWHRLGAAWRLIQALRSCCERGRDNGCHAIYRLSLLTLLCFTLGLWVFRRWLVRITLRSCSLVFLYLIVKLRWLGLDSIFRLWSDDLNLLDRLIVKQHNLSWLLSLRFLILFRFSRMNGVLLIKWLRWHNLLSIKESFDVRQFDSTSHNFFLFRVVAIPWVLVTAAQHVVCIAWQQGLFLTLLLLLITRWRRLAAVKRLFDHLQFWLELHLLLLKWSVWLLWLLVIKQLLDKLIIGVFSLLVLATTLYDSATFSHSPVLSTSVGVLRCIES